MEKKAKKTVKKPAQTRQKASRSTRKKTEKNNLGLYANLVHRNKTKKDAAARKKAEYLATLPKNPFKRFLYRLHPKRFFKYWFSKEGGIMALKIFGGLMATGLIVLFGLFAYFQKDLDQLRPGELSKRVQTTVNKYYDRNGELLWEDKGEGDYKLVVESNDISEYMKQATVAIEDRDFYKHKGIDLWALTRAVVNNLRGGAVQGGSTLTQQLIKQVYFADEAAERGIGGIPRKIKEMILAVKVEQMYDKDQIIALYLNESPYGGRRNGVESGAKTYFGKSAKDLTLPEAALLAGIPNNPWVYNPYNVDYNEQLIQRQHKVLDDMVICDFITQKEADEAKKFPILDSIRPEQEQYKDMKAPHFVQEVKRQLESEFGVRVIRAGGLTIKTTLDLRAQTAAEEAVAAGAETLYLTGADNIAITSVDVETGQVIAQVGSVDYNKDIYGQTNAAVSQLDPGSSIKPIVDYAALFKRQQSPVYTPATILRDENIDSLYCGGNTGQCQLRNVTGKFYGDITIRQSLGNSFNIAAVKALHIAGVDEGISTAHALGNLSYCADNRDAGLSAAIGGGCSVRQDEHTNSYASLARGGVYKPVSYVIEVKNSSNEKIKEWKDSSTKAVDPQVAYMLTNILADKEARLMNFGGQSYSFGFTVPNVWTASKTGTTDDSRGNAKDSWMMSYSPVVATGAWSGNHDGSALGSSSNTTVRRVINDYMASVHTNVYGPDGKWKVGDQVARPQGIQNCTVSGRNDICPSWWNQNNSSSKTQEIEFDEISKKRATACTPESTRIKLQVVRSIDPITKREILIAPDGYNANEEDDVHKCDDAKPDISLLEYTSLDDSGPYKINIAFSKGRFDLQEATVSVGGQQIWSGNASSGRISINHTFTGSRQKITVRVRDSGGYVSEKTWPGPDISKTPPGGNDDNGEDD